MEEEKSVNNDNNPGFGTDGFWSDVPARLVPLLGIDEVIIKQIGNYRPPETPEERAKDAFFLEKKCERICLNINRSCVALGALLSIVKKHRLFEQLDYEDFNSWIASPEIKLSYDRAQRYIRMWETLIVDVGCDLQDVERLGPLEADRIGADVRSNKITKPQARELVASVIANKTSDSITTINVTAGQEDPREKVMDILQAGLYVLRRSDVPSEELMEVITARLGRYRTKVLRGRDGELYLRV